MTDAHAVDDVETFDPDSLQDGLLMHITDVHERLAEARERGPVMLGNPFLETTAPNIKPADVTVLGYDAAEQVLTDPETFLNDTGPFFAVAVRLPCMSRNDKGPLVVSASTDAVRGASIMMKAVQSPPSGPLGCKVLPEACTLICERRRSASAFVSAAATLHT